MASAVARADLEQASLPGRARGAVIPTPARVARRLTTGCWVPGPNRQGAPTGRALPPGRRTLRESAGSERVPSPGGRTLRESAPSGSAHTQRRSQKLAFWKRQNGSLIDKLSPSLPGESRGQHVAPSDRILHPTERSGTKIQVFEVCAFLLLSSKKWRMQRTRLQTTRHDIEMRSDWWIPRPPELCWLKSGVRLLASQ